MADTSQNNQIIIYRNKQSPKLEVKLKDHTVWLNQQQISELFGTDRSVITRHINNILKSGELKEKSNVQFLHIANSDKPVKFYSLDMIISVGYRTNSKQATTFRIWATNKLRELIVKGYTIHEQRLRAHEAKVKELEQARGIFAQALESRRTEGYEKDLLNIITDYLGAWVILDQYDSGDLEINRVTKRPAKFLDYERVLESIDRFRAQLVKAGYGSDLFGRDTGHRLPAILKSIEQSYNSKDLYPSLEEKAAHLFYFVIKDHPFVDGNKRIGSLLLLLFLIQNHYLYNRRGDRKVTESTLVPLALLVAESKPQQKDVMIKLIINMINKR